MKAKFIYVFLTCLMIGSQLGLSAQTSVNKDKKKRHTPEQVMEHQTNQMVKMLMLDDATTAKFIPVYQNYLKELRECRMMNRAKQRAEGTGVKPEPKPLLTDAEVEQQIKDVLPKAVGFWMYVRSIIMNLERYFLPNRL